MNILNDDLISYIYNLSIFYEINFEDILEEMIENV